MKIIRHSNSTQKNLLYKQFVAWSYNGCSSAPLTDYINNQVYQELIDEDSYNGVHIPESKRWIYFRGRKLDRNDSKINLLIQLKNSTAHKLRLRVWAYSLGEYLYVPSRQGLTLKHKTYSIAQDNKFLEWEDSN